MPLDIGLVRVDNRLIHGQILEAWVPSVKAVSIAVVDDEVAGDLFRATVIRMAVPREVDVIISGVEEFADKYKYTTGPGRKTIVLFSSITDAVRAFYSGFKFAKLNLGNVHKSQDAQSLRLRYSSCIFLNNDEIENLWKLINDNNVLVELQRIPLDTAVDARTVLPA